MDEGVTVMSKQENLIKAKLAFRKKGVTLFADKTKAGGGGSWKFASEDNLVQTISPALYECGLEIFSEMEFLDGSQFASVTLAHESGESRTSRVLLREVTPKKDRNGNPLWLDAEIERGKQFGYWSRILTMRILGLSDVESPEFMNSPIMSEDEQEAEYNKHKKDIKEVIELARGNGERTSFILGSAKVNTLEEVTPENISMKTVSSLCARWAR